jgi:hypothetical protein
MGAMADLLDVQAEVLNFREEARGCLHLAQAEGLPEVRTGPFNSEVQRLGLLSYARIFFI